MDPQVQASFIPKRSLESAPREGGPFGLLFLIALLVFIASIASAGGAFLYTQYLQNAATSKAKSLALAEGAFDPGTIEDLVRTDSRLTQSKTLLAKHTAVSGVFAFLATQTLERVSFSSFSFVQNADGTAKILLKGTANSFSTVALQSDQFGSNKLLKNVVFSAITVDTNGMVGFVVSADLDPSVFSYENSIGTSAPVPAATSLPQTTPVSTSSATSTQ